MKITGITAAEATKMARMLDDAIEDMLMDGTDAEPLERIQYALLEIQ